MIKCSAPNVHILAGKGGHDMKRFHIHLGVEALDESIRFYSALFGAEPVKRNLTMRNGYWTTRE